MQPSVGWNKEKGSQQTHMNLIDLINMVENERANAQYHSTSNYTVLTVATNLHTSTFSTHIASSKASLVDSNEMTNIMMM